MRAWASVVLVASVALAAAALFSSGAGIIPTQPSTMTIQPPASAPGPETEVEYKLMIDLHGYNPAAERDWHAIAWQAYWTYDPNEVEVLDLQPNYQLFALPSFATWEVRDGVGYVQAYVAIDPAYGQEPVPGEIWGWKVRCEQSAEGCAFQWDERLSHPESGVFDEPGIPGVEVDPLLLVECSP